MIIGVLTLTFRLEGCHSLKEKRHRISGLRDKFGRLVNVAVSEVGFQDVHQQAWWAFVVLANDKILAEKMMTKIEADIAGFYDVQITDVQKEFL